MSIQRLFPTPVYTAPLIAADDGGLNARLLAECRQLERDDRAGRLWSASHYPGGYTSYGSANRMHRVSPTFAALEKHLAPHVRVLVRELEFDLGGRRLRMTDCWVNVMRRQAQHGLHLHPLSALSGTYYVRMPSDAPGLKLEDPRLDRQMAAPPRLASAAIENRQWVTLPARAGHIVLFESWLRHEVPANRARAARISISFNYGWS
jgi:uncharacterized protein (TIGR02466 family)